MHNLQIPRITSFYKQGSTNKDLQTRFYKQGSTIQERPSSVGVLQPYFNSSKGISRTSLRCEVLNKICHCFFSYNLLNARKQRNYYPRATYEDNFSTQPQPRISFWFTSRGFLKKPVSLKYWLLHPFFYKEATCKGSAIKRLLYTAKAVP